MSVRRQARSSQTEPMGDQHGNSREQLLLPAISHFYGVFRPCYSSLELPHRQLLHSHVSYHTKHILDGFNVPKVWITYSGGPGPPPPPRLFLLVGIWKFLWTWTLTPPPPLKNSGLEPPPPRRIPRSAPAYTLIKCRGSRFGFPFFQAFNEIHNRKHPV